MLYPTLEVVRRTLQFRLWTGLTLLTLAACGGGSGSNGNTVSNPGDGSSLVNNQAFTLQGSVGDGPIVNAQIVVRDANGQIVAETLSDDAANYAVTIPAQTHFPVRISAFGGVDLVSGDPADFELQAVALTPDKRRANVSPFTTLVVRGASCLPQGLNQENIERLWQHVADSLSMGFDPALMPNPMHDAVTAVNAAAVVYANEGLGETIRRTQSALTQGGVAVGIEQLVSNLACDLARGRIDGQGGNSRYAATFNTAAAGVQLEVLARQLYVNQQNAMASLDAALATILPAQTGLSVHQVPVTQQFVAQTLGLIRILDEVYPSSRFLAYSQLLAEYAPNQIPAALAVAFTSADQLAMDALVQQVAQADQQILTSLIQAGTAQPGALPPLVTFSAGALQVSPGASTNLTWSSFQSNYCVADGSWSGEQALSGSYQTGALFSDRTYHLTCAGLGGTQRQTLHIQVVNTVPEPTPDPPQISFAASRDTVGPADTFTLSWSTTGATSCSASGSWGGSRPLSGSTQQGPLSTDAQYVLSCQGPGGSGTAVVWVTLVIPPVPEPEPEPLPVVSLQATPSQVDAGGSSQLTWSSTHATSCVATGGWSGGRAVAGSASTGSLANTTQFGLSCTGPGGTASATTTVIVQQPPVSVQLSASPQSVGFNESVTLTWSSTNATSCVASGGWSGTRATAGSFTLAAISSDTTFTISCSGAGGQAVAMTSVSLLAAILSWQAPTSYMDGSPLTVASYRLHYGTSSGHYQHMIEVSSLNTYLELPLNGGNTYYFAIKAVDADGRESAFSNEVFKEIM